MMRRSRVQLLAVLALVPLCGLAVYAQATQTKPFEPTVGQPGKDVVWVPTSQKVVDKMLDLAKLTPQDFLMDLGSGDGRTVITAAKRGARAMGVEFNPDMVELSKRKAAEQKVTERATFVEGDLFKADITKAQVITMFLLPSINMRLRPQILDLRPGTRIVSNTFDMTDWEPDVSETVQDCDANYCTVLVWIVPAKVNGTWQLGSDTLTIEQKFQNFTGKMGSANVTDGKLNGAQISFSAGNTKFTGSVNGNAMSGTTSSGGSWKATKR
jgi:precorrin-6B methylase 2